MAFRLESASENAHVKGAFVSTVRFPCQPRRLSILLRSPQQAGQTVGTIYTPKRALRLPRVRDYSSGHSKSER